jgi:hypothetical protein
MEPRPSISKACFLTANNTTFHPTALSRLELQGVEVLGIRRNLIIAPILIYSRRRNLKKTHNLLMPSIIKPL